MAMHDIVSGAGASAPQKQSAFNSLNLAATEIISLVAHIEALAERLVGPGPAPKEPEVNTVNAGLFGLVQDQATIVIGLVGRGHEALYRIERQLP